MTGRERPREPREAADAPVAVAPPIVRNRKEHPFVGQVSFRGLRVDLENPRGGYREGVGDGGRKWRTYMRHHYGEIRRTKGADGEAVDVYVGPDAASDRVFVVHQNDPTTGRYDEDKVLLGFDSRAAAVSAYMSQYDRPGFMGGVDELSFDEFKAFLAHQGNLGRKITAKGAARAAR